MYVEMKGQTGKKEVENVRGNKRRFLVTDSSLTAASIYIGKRVHNQKKRFLDRKNKYRYIKYIKNAPRSRLGR
jgi:hypothetical protein